MRLWPGQFLITAVVVILNSCQSAGPMDSSGRPLIVKLGTIDCDLVETTPMVFKGKLYRFEWERSRQHFRFIDHDTGQSLTPFAHGHTFGSAFVEGDTIYVTGSTGDDESGWGAGHGVDVFVSNDLENWQSWPALNLPDFAINNTSVCKAGDRYVMLFNFHKPKVNEQNSFPCRFATSIDFQHWELLPAEQVYTENHYAAPLTLRYQDGYYYVFYLERTDGSRNFETKVSRSKDLIHWQSSPLDPVLTPTEADRKIASPRLSDIQRKKIAQAKNINNSDMDFCEFQGRVIINYSWGDQEGKEFLAEAIYQGTERQFIEGWFCK